MGTLLNSKVNITSKKYLRNNFIRNVRVVRANTIEFWLLIGQKELTEIAIDSIYTRY